VRTTEAQGELLFPTAFARVRASFLALVAVSPPRGASMLPSAQSHVDFHVALNFGAQSHGLFARCLRFAAFLPGCPVVRPRKTRFRLVVSLCHTGLRPLGSLVKFLLRLHRFLLTQAVPGALVFLPPGIDGGGIASLQWFVV
jgi:hypothetical protein